MKFLMPVFALVAAVSAASVQVGGRHKIDPNNASLKEVLGVAEHQISNQINSMYSQKIVRVLEAESQVVSGVMYHIKFELGQTACLKSELESGKVDAKTCEPKDHFQQCEARILSQPWLKNTEVSHIQCQQPQQQVAGGYSPVDPKSETWTLIGGFLGKLNREISRVIGGENYYMNTKIVEAESQVVAGMNYKVKFEMTETRCSAKAELFAECQGHLKPENVKHCTAVIYSKPWANVLTVSQVNCQ